MAETADEKWLREIEEIERQKEEEKWLRTDRNDESTMLYTLHDVRDRRGRYSPVNEIMINITRGVDCDKDVRLIADRVQAALNAEPIETRLSTAADVWEAAAALAETGIPPEVFASLARQNADEIRKLIPESNNDNESTPGL